MNKKIISTVLFLSLATVTYTPFAKCVNPETPFKKIAKIATYSTLGTGAIANGALLGIASILSICLSVKLLKERPHLPRVAPIVPIVSALILVSGIGAPILAFGSLSSFYTSYHLFKNAIKQ